MWNSPAADQTSQVLSTRDVLRILFRHQRKAAVTSITILALVFVGLVFCTKNYLSESKLFIRVGRESVGLDPTATADQSVAMRELTENEIQSLVDVLDSQVLLEKVVDSIGAENILRQSLEPPKPESFLHLNPLRWIWATLATALPKDKVSDREKAVHQLGQSLSIIAGKQSRVITIKCKTESPQLSQRIVQEFVDAFRAEHLRLNRTPGSQRFLEQQTQLLHDKLTFATEQLRDAKNNVGLLSIDGQKRILEQQISDLNRGLVQTESDLSSANSKISALRAKYPDLVVDAENGSALSRSAVDEMRDRLYSLQIRERELAAKYQPAHPELIAIKYQRQESERILSQQELLIELSNAASAKAKAQAAQQKLAETQGKLKASNEHEVLLTQLQHEVDLLTNDYRTYKHKLEMARFDQDLVSNQISNINVVQPATFVAKAVSPRRSLIAVLGLMVAALAGVAVALLCELLDHSFRTPEQIESKLAVPVLLSIPHLKRQGVLLN